MTTQAYFLCTGNPTISKLAILSTNMSYPGYPCGPNVYTKTKTTTPAYIKKDLGDPLKSFSSQCLISGLTPTPSVLPPTPEWSS